MKNTGYDNYQLQKNIDDIHKPESFEYFDVSGLVDRIRIQHHMDMNAKQRSIEKELFITENDRVYEIAEELMKSHIAPGSSTRKNVKYVLDDTIQTMYAQKLLSGITDNMNQKQLDNWYNGFIEKMDAIKLLSTGSLQMVPAGMRAIIQKKVDNGETLTSAQQKKLAEMQREDALVSEFAGVIENTETGETVSIEKFLSENEFLHYLEVIEVKGKKKIVLKKTFKALSSKEMDMVSNSFNDISNLMPSLAKEILDYQLLTNGLNDKIGSFAVMLPNHIHTKYLQELSKASINKQNTVKEQTPAYVINASIKMKDSFIEASTLEKKPQTGMYLENGKLMYFKKGKAYPPESFGSFMTNGTYYKFGDIKEFTKLETGKANPTQEEIEEIKKCLRNG